MYIYIYIYIERERERERERYHDRGDLDYHGIRDTENLFGANVNNEDYYKPILVKSSFKKKL